MRKLDVGQTIGIVANVGVILGIVFLAIEVRQNNSLIESEQQYRRDESMAEAVEAVFSNPSLAAAIAKKKANQPLNELEQLQLDAFNVRVVMGIQRNYFEWQRGRIPALSADGLRDRFYRGGVEVVPLVEFWAANKDEFRPEFIEWVEENVFGH